MRATQALLTGQKGGESQGASAIVLENRTLGDEAGRWNRINRNDNDLEIYRLQTARNRDWHEAVLPTQSWLAHCQAGEPLPVAHITTSDEKLAGIIHLRLGKELPEICLSLVTSEGVWQTGVWLEIAQGDEVSVSWCTDCHGKDVSTISLEIMKPTQH